MGDRASVSFRKDGYESVTLCSHWGGTQFQQEAVVFARELKAECAAFDNYVGTPLNRLEPNTVMVDFIRHLTSGLVRVGSNYYLGATPDDVDNSNNGHRVIEL